MEQELPTHPERHGRWFSPASSTTKTGRHDIAEILLKVALKHQKSKIKSISSMMLEFGFETKKMAPWCHI
jgi:hypothetical protein